ncbi:MAG: Sapep family Mn(2+)-dependent dipeptidase [Clostridiales bacterium]|nr:Sapep family Mn(2+)-dependent dipeptidase [Clostridiales bacterium]
MNYELDNIITDFLANNRENFIKDLQKLIRIDSTFADDKSGKPYGAGNAKAIDFMMDLCKDAGLECRNIDYYCMDATHGEGKEVIASLSHLDIVPVGDGWIHNPLGGEVEGDIIYGRGVNDDKGPLLASLYALKALLSNNTNFNRKIRLIFGCDEERGMSDMKYYLEKCQAPDYAFSPDAYFPTVHAEKTIIGGTYKTNIKKPSIVQQIFGGTTRNVVPSSATAIVSRIGSFHNDPNIVVEDKDGMYKITATGLPAHASTPEQGKNALVILFKYLKRVLPKGDPYKLIAEKFFSAFQFTDGSKLKIDCYDKATGALTINLGVVQGNKDAFEAVFDCRHPVTLDDELTHKKLTNAIKGFKLANCEVSKGLYWPTDHPLIKTLQNVYKDITGDKTLPKTMGGGTYARALPCAVAFGPVFPDSKPKGAHMAEENASIDELLKAARIYAHSFYELANME